MLEEEEEEEDNVSKAKRPGDDQGCLLVEEGLLAMMRSFVFASIKRISLLVAKGVISGLVRLRLLYEIITKPLRGFFPF